MATERSQTTVLPKSGERNILITSALPYVNNVPHLGNVIGSVLSADVFARYCRGRGLNTLYVCDFAKVPLPGYDDKVIYPWFDACIGYVSITANYTKDWEQWWRRPDDVELYQFLGKDNVVFHSVIFPGTQLGTHDTWTKAHHISSTEYLTYEGGKFSKSRGIGVFGDSAQMTGVASDSWRFYLLSQRPETADSEFNWDAMISANNNLLLKNLGNFISRIVKFVNSANYQSIVPDYTEYHEDSFDEFRKDVNDLLAQYVQELDAVKIRAGLSTVMQISSRGNLFLQTSGLDNKLVQVQPLKCAAVVGLAINLAHLLASVVAPYMPTTSEAINEQLRSPPLIIPDTWSADSIKPKHELGPSKHLFSNIKAEKADEWRQLFGGDEARRLREEEAEKKSKKKAFAKAKKAPKEKKENKQKEEGQVEKEQKADGDTEELPLRN